jgi:hypothetical protein
MLMLTEGLARAGWPCKGVGDVDRGRRRGGAHGEGCCRGPLAPGLHGSAQSGAVKELRGLRRSGNHRRQGIEVAGRLTGGGPRCNSGRYTGWGRG